MLMRETIVGFCLHYAAPCRWWCVSVIGRRWCWVDIVIIIKSNQCRAVKIACPRRLCQPCGQLKTNIWGYTRTTRFDLPLKSWYWHIFSWRVVKTHHMHCSIHRHDKINQTFNNVTGKPTFFFGVRTTKYSVRTTIFWKVVVLRTTTFWSDFYCPAVSFLLVSLVQKLFGETKYNNMTNPNPNKKRPLSVDSDSDQNMDETRTVSASDDWPRFIILFIILSPFVNHKGIMGIAGTVKDTKKLRSGQMLVECVKKARANNLLRATTLVGVLSSQVLEL